MAQDDMERLEELQAERQRAVASLKQIRKEERRIRARRTRAERAARTKRLIEAGAVVEAALGIELDSDARREALNTVLREQHLTMRDGSRVTLDQWLHDLITDELRRRGEPLEKTENGQQGATR
jgi:hypothetical protein